MGQFRDGRSQDRVCRPDLLIRRFLAVEGLNDVHGAQVLFDVLVEGLSASSSWYPRSVIGAA